MNTKETLATFVKTALDSGDYGVVKGVFGKPVIEKARITAMPVKITDDMPRVMVTFSNSDEEEMLFDFYPDEISFKAEEFLGLTRDEAYALKGKKDREYLRS